MSLFSPNTSLEGGSFIYHVKLRETSLLHLDIQASPSSNKFYFKKYVN